MTYRQGQGWRPRQPSHSWAVQVSEGLSDGMGAGLQGLAYRGWQFYFEKVMVLVGSLRQP